MKHRIKGGISVPAHLDATATIKRSASKVKRNSPMKILRELASFETFNEQADT